MTPLSMAWLPLCVTVFSLGLRHGLDADHLATIDGLTRFNSSARPKLARWCGALFSAGHGCIVIAVAVATVATTTRYTIPDWARDFGAWVSIGCLVVLGVINLTMVVRTPADEMVKAAGLRSRLLSRLTRTTQPLAIAAVGALFALSFDTLSQALLFSATATQFGGWQSALWLGVLFALGMLFVDGLNGAWVAALLRRADRRARVVSRAIGLFVALLSFAVAGLGAIRYFNPRMDAGLESWGLPIGVSILIAVALGSYLLNSTAARARADDASHQASRLRWE
jgi:high-affinity nickel-transport protein